MEDWMRLPVSQLKRLVKSRAGRIAELQMEVKILEGVIERKVRDGDLGGSAQVEKPAKKETGEPPKEESQNEEPETEETKNSEEEKPESPGEESKIREKSSDHAFREID